MTENIVEDIMEISEITGNIELSGGSQQEPYLLGNLKKIKEEKDISFLIHNYFPPPKNHILLNIANTDDVTRGFIKETMEYVRGLEIDYYSIHSGYTRDLYFENELWSPDPMGKQYTLDGIYENVEWFRKEFPETKLALENMNPSNNNEENIFFCHIDRIIDILENNKEIYLLLDLGHLKISSVILDFDFHAAAKILFDTYIDRILEIHLSENEGLYDDHNLILSDSLQYKMIKENAESIIRREINVTLEARGQSLEDLQECYLLIEETLST